MKIGIIGHLGTVGGAMKTVLEERGHVVVGYDIREEDNFLIDVKGTEICFICVPTPEDPKTGRCDTSKVEEVVHGLVRGIKYEGAIVIRSTVEPGTTFKLFNKYRNWNNKICYVPEFLKERQAVEDVRSTKKAIMGVVEGDYSLRSLISVALGVPVGNVEPVGETNAEFLKYFHNCFNALRVVFANEFNELMKRSSVTADYQSMLETYRWFHDTEAEYLDVGRYLRGYGGSCLPKDVRAMKALAPEHIKTFKYIDDTNKRYVPSTLDSGINPFESGQSFLGF